MRMTKTTETDFDGYDEYDDYEVDLDEDDEEEEEEDDVQKQKRDKGSQAHEEDEGDEDDDKLSEEEKEESPFLYKPSEEDFVESDLRSRRKRRYLIGTHSFLELVDPQLENALEPGAEYGDEDEGAEAKVHKGLNLERDNYRDLCKQKGFAPNPTFLKSLGHSTLDLRNQHQSLASIYKARALILSILFKEDKRNEKCPAVKKDAKPQKLGLSKPINIQILVEITQNVSNRPPNDFFIFLKQKFSKLELNSSFKMTRHRITTRSQNSFTISNISTPLNPTVSISTPALSVPDDSGKSAPAILPTTSGDINNNDFGFGDVEDLELFGGPLEWMDEMGLVTDLQNDSAFRLDMSSVPCIASSGLFCLCADCLQIPDPQNVYLGDPSSETSLVVLQNLEDDLNQDANEVEWIELDTFTTDSGIETGSSESSAERTISETSPPSIPFQPLIPRMSMSSQSRAMMAAAFTPTAPPRNRRHSTPSVPSKEVMQKTGRERRHSSRKTRIPSRFIDGNFETDFL